MSTNAFEDLIQLFIDLQLNSATVLEPLLLLPFHYFHKRVHMRDPVLVLLTDVVPHFILFAHRSQGIVVELLEVLVVREV